MKLWLLLTYIKLHETVILRTSKRSPSRGAACKLDCYDCEPLYYAVKQKRPTGSGKLQLLLQHGGAVERNSKFRGDPIGAAVWNLNERMITLQPSARVLT